MSNAGVDPVIDRQRIKEFKAKISAGEVAPSRLTFRETRVLSIDQSLSNTGWVLMETGGNHVDVLFKGTLRPKTDLTSHEGDLDKAEQLCAMLADMAAKVEPLISHNFTVVAERPALFGRRLESSFMALREVHRLSCHMGWDLRIVSNLQMKARLGISNKSDKRMIKEALIPYVPEVAGPKWNEHTRDALALGLTSVIAEE